MANNRIYTQTEDNVVQWVEDHPLEDGTPSSTQGIIVKGRIRQEQVQTGTEMVDTGETEMVDTGRTDMNGEPIMEEQPITTEEPVFETQSYDEWQRMLDQEAAGDITIQWLSDVEKAHKLEQEAKAQIDRKRDELIHSGIEHNGNSFQTRQRDIEDLMGLIQLGQISESQGQSFSTTWLTANNKRVDMTLADLVSLGSAIGQMKTAYVYKARDHKDSIANMSVPADIENYMATIDWTI